jgi:hypothetical protein
VAGRARPEISDPPIGTLLAELGFVTLSEQAVARAALEGAKLTRSGKQAISASKLPLVRDVLTARFALSCSACGPVVRSSRPDAQVLVVADERCQNCSGSDHRAAALRFIAACRAHRVSRVLVVGGSPAGRQAVTRHLDGLDVQLVDGTGALSLARARQLLARADLVLIWGKSQLDHRVSTHFTSSGDPKVVTAAKRGVAGLLDAGTSHLARKGIA